MGHQEIYKVVTKLGGVRKASRIVGIPPSTLSEYLNNKYKGKKSRIEAVFNSYLNQIECPIFGLITKEACERNRSKKIKTTNSFNAKLYRNCMRCKIFKE